LGEINPETQNIVALAKLGQFRKNHPSVGAGIHSKFRRTLELF
jgi:hypothetical protein